MSLTDKSLKSKLAKYSKADIIDAVCDEFTADHIVHGMLLFLESRTFDRLMAKENKAFNAQSAAGNAYIDWHGEMIRKYGNGKEVNLADIPRAEMDKGIRLGKAWEEAGKKAEAATKALDRKLKEMQA